jgi:hypothetical protein
MELSGAFSPLNVTFMETIDDLEALPRISHHIGMLAGPRRVLAAIQTASFSQGDNKAQHQHYRFLIGPNAASCT